MQFIKDKLKSSIIIFITIIELINNSVDSYLLCLCTSMLIL